jgi:penicillin-binding protein 1A
MKLALNAKRVGFLAIGALLAGSLLVGLVIVWAVMNLPKLDNMQDYRPALGSTVLARDGRLLGEFYDTERRYLVSMEEVPEWVISSFLAAEDDGFFHHSGVDLLGIVRATWANLKAGGVVQGGSTITMQVAKGMLLSSERSMGRKLREVPLAYKIEKNFTKRQILYLYLNQIYFGQRAYGVEAAARVYFHKNVKSLTVAESALLAGLVKAPTSYAPTRGPVRAKERQLYVLRRMHELKLITEEQYQTALNEEVKVFPEENPNELVAPYYLEHVRQLALKKYGADAVYRGGLTIETAADYDLSKAAMKAVRANLEELDKRQGYRGAVGHVSTEAQVAETLKEIKGDVLAKKFGYFILPTKLPENFNRHQYVDFTLGRLKQQDPTLADERKLLLPWEKYRAVVTKIDADGKAADVAIGSIPGRLPISQMRWAKHIKPPELANWATINKVSETLKTGDVILVKPVLPITEAANEPVTVSLEQEPLAQSALLSMEAATGYVVAMVGGYNFGGSEYNRALQGERQPGSAFKPLLYSAALDKGYTPSSIIVDSPIIFENQGGEGSSLKWIPENNSDKYYGDTTLRTAVINSRNIPAVKLLQEMGLSYFSKYLRALGVGGEFTPDLSLALGSKAISLLELTKFYALFPRLGLRIEPVFVLKVSDREGKALEEYSFKEFQKELSNRWLEWKKSQGGGKAPAATPAPAVEVAEGEEAAAPMDQATKIASIKEPPTFDDPLRAMDERTAFVMGQMLQEVVQYGTGSGARALKRRVGGKTGTTNDFIDAWFMGFSPELVTGVWTGFDNPRTLGRGEVGGRASLPAWTDYMAAALERYKVDDFPVPSGIVFVRIDPKTGALAGPGNSSGVKEAFVEGTEPSLERQNTQAPDSSDFFREDL